MSTITGNVWANCNLFLAQDIYTVFSTKLDLIPVIHQPFFN